MNIFELADFEYNGRGGEDWTEQFVAILKTVGFTVFNQPIETIEFKKGDIYFNPEDYPGDVYRVYDGEGQFDVVGYVGASDDESLERQIGIWTGSDVIVARIDLKYICDKSRHLICIPYSIYNLHRMADDLGIKRCWFHKDHYDIPKRRVDEIVKKCGIVDSRTILGFIKMIHSKK